MKQEDFKMRCWIPDNNIMLYSDTDYEQYFIMITKFGIEVYYTPIIKLDDIVEYSESFKLIYSIPMFALPMKDCEGNKIYDGDILECTWSDYYDPCGTKYPKSTSVRIIADIYDAYVIPSYARIIGNKYENKELYKETLWYLEFKARWSIITTQSYEERNKHSNLREGQALFNALSKYYSEIAEQITGTEYDCFNDDSKIEAFKERVIDLWIGEIE